MKRHFPLGRRALLLAAGALVVAPPAVAKSLGRDPVLREIAAIERRAGGRLGVAALDSGTGRRLSYRGDERFALCSTFKWMLAAAVLHRVDDGALRLDQAVPYGAADLLDYAPYTREHLSAGSRTISQLCGAAVEVSDNTAANLLLRLIGGPPALTDFLRASGDPVTRLDRFEGSLNSNDPGDPRDTTTPDAMVPTMKRILVGDVLSSGARDQLVAWMKNCQTGLRRLRAGLPTDWVVGDKTGTGSHGAANDCAIIWPPGRAPLLVAAYLSGSTRSPEVLDAAHKELGQLIARVLV